ncbi:MAG: AgmX/PglI C-terminal domain-containing protein, partial [Myxococcales bacterium]|nr:AgmX/PglI C-terminal domain-containing protein [Myxococcales bacterium]
MSGGAILAIIGCILCLIGPNLGMGGGTAESEPSGLGNLFSMVYIEEFNYKAIAGLQLVTGQISALLALVGVAMGAVVFKARRRKPGWILVLISLAQILLAWQSFDDVYALTPCKSLDLPFCADSGSLIPETYIHMNGLVWIIFGSIFAFLGGLTILASFDEYKEDQRFLRVALEWNDQTVAERVFFIQRSVTIGESDANLFQVAAKGLTSHTLFTPAGSEKYRLDVPSGLAGEITVGGQKKEASGSVEVSRGDSGRFSFENGVHLVFNFAAPQAGAIIGSGRDRNAALEISFAAVASLFGIMFVLVNSVAKMDEDAFDREQLAQKNRGLIEVAVEEKELKPEEIKPEGQDEDTTSKKAGGEEGKFGDAKEDPNKKSKVPRMDGPMRDKIDVKNIGIAKALSGAQAMTGALGNIMAGDTGAISSKMAVAMGGEGSELVIGHGSGGMGFQGTGGGGGGDGTGRLHGLGSIDTGGGTGRNADLGIGRKSSKKVAKLNIAQGQSTGGCDKGDISKNVRARAASLRACYETQLMAKPDLAGKVTVQWTITADGSV